MEYLAVALLSCLIGACGIGNQKTEAIQGEMPFIEGTPTKILLQEMPDLIGKEDTEENRLNREVGAALTGVKRK